MSSRPRFLQGVFSYEGQGLGTPVPIDEALTYIVPPDHEAQLVYFRAGNATDALVDAVILRDGEPMRHFPVGAQDAVHVALRVVEDLPPGTRIDVHVGAEGPGRLVLDLGLVEI